MRLTNYDRDTFIRAVMLEVPSTVDAIETELDKQVQEAALEAVPESIKKIWRDQNLRAYLRTETVSVGSGSLSWYSVSVIDADANTSKKLTESVRDLLQRRTDEIKLREELEAGLRGVVYGCTTTKQLRERLPEFEKHVPADDHSQATANVPMVQLITKFVSAGWKAE